MLETIVSKLKGTAKSDAFCTKLGIPFGDLTLSVDPVGTLKFPIAAKVAKSLIVEAELARFGKRDKTILDRRIRDVWEIPKDRIHTNDRWEKQLELVLHQIQKNLKLPEDGKLSAELHNLLIYMPGQFFKGHQDSEKSDGMLATLVVLLPSAFSGGALVIDQHGDKRSFDASKNIENEINFIAFYSDCHHEVKKVTSGYRIALTYNLIFKAPSKMEPLQRNERLERELKSYFSETKIEESSYGSKHPRWFVYLLDHQYTQKSLSWDGLRGADRQRVAELLSSADSLGLEAHLSLADIHEMWSTESDDSWYGYGGYNRRGRYYDEPVEEEDEASEKGSLGSAEYELTELIEDDFELRHWVDRDGRHLNRKEHHVPRNMVCWTKAVDKFTPFNTEYEGYMGNYGNTLDRWYHRAAIVLWRRDSEFTNLFASDSEEALKKIAHLLKKDLEAGRSAIQQILPLWPKFAGALLRAPTVFEVASLVQNPKVASQLIEALGLVALNGSANSQFMKLIETYGEDWCLIQLHAWEKLQNWDDSGSIITNLVRLTKDLSRQYKKVSSWILEYHFSSLVSDDKSTQKISSLRDLKAGLKERLKIVGVLLKATMGAGDPEVHQKMIEHILTYPSLYPGIDLVGLIEKHGILQPDASGKWGHRKFIKRLMGRIEEEASFKRENDDWSIRGTTSHHCPDCKILQKFLSSSTEEKLVWPLAKPRRQHIHRIVDGMDIPVTHTTLREGSPQKLILTKTTDLFTRDEAHVKAAVLALAKLKKIM